MNSIEKNCTDLVVYLSQINGRKEKQQWNL